MQHNFFIYIRVQVDFSALFNYYSTEDTNLNSNRSFLQ